MHTLFLALFFIFNPLCDIANGRENHALNLLRGAIDGVENGPVKKWIILKSNALQKFDLLAPAISFTCYKKN